MDEENITLEEPLNKNFREPKIRFPEFNADPLKTTRIGNISKINRGGSPRPIDHYISKNGEGINWIRISDASPDGYVYETAEKIIPEGAKKSFMIHEGDLLLSNSMSFGRAYISKIDGCIHDGWLCLTPKENVISSKYLMYYLSSNACLKQFSAIAAGGVVSNLNKEIVSNVTICLPQKEEQEKIANVFYVLDSIIKAVDNKKNVLKKYKEGFVNNWFSKNKSNGCLGNIVHKVHTTLTISSCLGNTGDYPVYDANGDIIAYTNFYNNAYDSIAIITRGSCGRTFKTYGKHSVLGTMEELIVDKEEMYYYVYAFTKSSYFKRLCNERIERGAVPALYPEDYLSARLYIPNQSTIEKFTRMFNLFEEIESLTNKEVNLLSSIKKQLLKDVFV